MKRDSLRIAIGKLPYQGNACWLIVADVFDEQGKWLYTKPVIDEPIYTEWQTAQIGLAELQQMKLF